MCICLWWYWYFCCFVPATDLDSAWRYRCRIFRIFVCLKRESFTLSLSVKTMWMKCEDLALCWMGKIQVNPDMQRVRLKNLASSRVRAGLHSCFWQMMVLLSAMILKYFRLAPAAYLDLALQEGCVLPRLWCRLEFLDFFIMNEWTCKKECASIVSIDWEMLMYLKYIF